MNSWLQCYSKYIYGQSNLTFVSTRQLPEGEVELKVHARNSSLNVAIIALIAAAYSLLTVALGSLGYSWVQVRISEALTPLPFLLGFPAVIGLTLGCAVANFFSPVGMPDLVFGPLLTLCAAFLSWKLNCGRKILSCVYPVLINAFGVSAYIYSFYGVSYIVSVATIAIGEFIAAVLIGYPLLAAIEKTRVWLKKNEEQPKPIMYTRMSARKWQTTENQEENQNPST